jgi:hypothetical protein
MNEHRESYLELCAGYLLGVLDEPERSALEAHLAEGCPECEAELRSLGAGALALAHAAPAWHAPATLRGRVMDAVRAEPSPALRMPRDAGRGAVTELRPTRRRTMERFLVGALAAAAVLIAIAGIVEWREKVRLERALVATRGQISDLQARLEDEQSWSDLVAGRGAVAVDLAPTSRGAAPLSARVSYDPARRRAVIVCANAAAPSGKDYQLWAITKSGPSSLGLIRGDRSGHAVVRLPHVADPATLNAFAISLEQTGGSPNPNAPAGAVVMVGKLPG